jgi:putative flippase GtrA
MTRPRPRLPQEFKRFLITGATTAGGAFVLMSVLVAELDVPGQLALAITYTSMLALNFTLSRQWVWVHESGYAHHLTAQGRRYLTVALCGYLATALALATLPGLLDVRLLLVYFPTAAVVACANFVFSQIWVFRSRVPRLLLALRRDSRDGDG